MSPGNCPRCGEDDLVEGFMHSAGSVRFRPLETKFLTLRTPDVTVFAYMCTKCGALTLLGDTGKLEALKKKPVQPASAAPSSAGQP